mmetsp:Transcript_24421/g.77066  ORF Transcript_24421/g.77066 Transcript_24421/m.77066 type:complete len:109 (+) Transcript_24421:867-1193(+)
MHTREPHGPNPGAEEEDNVCETNKMKLKMTFPSFLRTTRPQRESTMGPWKKVIRVLSQLSVLTNVALMTVLETLVTDVSPLTRVLVAVAVEHLLLLLKDCVRSFIPGR